MSGGPLSACPTKIKWVCFVHGHVDDMTIVSNALVCFKNLISSRFPMEDLGEIKYLLGKKFLRNRKTWAISLSQDQYIKDLLGEYDMLNCKAVSTPFTPGTHLVLAMPEDMSNFSNLGISWRRAVGLLNYLSTATWGDLTIVVSQLSQNLEKPGLEH